VEVLTTDALRTELFGVFSMFSVHSVVKAMGKPTLVDTPTSNRDSLFLEEAV
jgi:hypothetical protein